MTKSTNFGFPSWRTECRIACVKRHTGDLLFSRRFRKDQCCLLRPISLSQHDFHYTAEPVELQTIKYSGPPVTLSIDADTAGEDEPEWVQFTYRNIYDHIKKEMKDEHPTFMEDEIYQDIVAGVHDLSLATSTQNPELLPLTLDFVFEPFDNNFDEPSCSSTSMTKHVNERLSEEPPRKKAKLFRERSKDSERASTDSPRPSVRLTDIFSASMDTSRRTEKRKEPKHDFSSSSHKEEKRKDNSKKKKSKKEKKEKEKRDSSRSSRHEKEDKKHRERSKDKSERKEKEKDRRRSSDHDKSRKSHSHHSSRQSEDVPLNTAKVFPKDMYLFDFDQPSPSGSDQSRPVPIPLHVDSEDVILLSPPRRAPPEVIDISNLPDTEGDIEVVFDSAIKEEPLKTANSNDDEESSEEDDYVMPEASASSCLFDVFDYYRSDSLAEDALSFPLPDIAVDFMSFLEYVRNCCTAPSKPFASLPYPAHRFEVYHHSTLINGLMQLIEAQPGNSQVEDFKTVMAKFEEALSVEARLFFSSTGVEKRNRITLNKLATTLKLMKTRPMEVWRALEKELKLKGEYLQQTKELWNSTMSSLYTLCSESFLQFANATQTKCRGDGVLRRRVHILFYGWRFFVQHGGYLHFFLSAHETVLESTITDALKALIDRIDTALKAYKEELDRGVEERVKLFAQKAMKEVEFEDLKKSCSAEEEMRFTIKCFKCHLFFSSDEMLERHNVAHSEKEYYECDVCCIGFNHRISLCAHYIDRHADSLISCDPILPE